MNTRIFNEQLAVVGQKAKEIHLEYGEDRRSGRTYRNILRALLYASSFPGTTTLYANYGPDASMHAFRMACDMTAGMDGRRAMAQERTLELPNGSRIKFRSSRDTGYEVGKTFEMLVRDAE